MSKQHTKRVWTWLRQVNRDSTMTGAAKGAAISIADHWNEEKGFAFPGSDVMAVEIGRAQSTALEGGNLLEEQGHLRIERGSKGSGNSHRYYPIIKPIEKYRSADISEPRKKYRPADISNPRRDIVTGDDEIPF